MGKYFKEFFSHQSVWVLSAVILLLLAADIPFLNRGSVWVAIVIGILVFYVSEYTNHRFYFHAAPSKHPFVLKLQKRIHYDHHEDPNDLELLFLPLWYSIPSYILLWAITFAITRSLSLATAVTLGGTCALLYYEWIHFVAHRPITPLTRWGKYMKKYHLLHHYKNENFWFGVTNPGMDHVFGTVHDEKKVELSQTARKLYEYSQDHSDHSWRG